MGATQLVQHYDEMAQAFLRYYIDFPLNISKHCKYQHKF